MRVFKRKRKIKLKPQKQRGDFLPAFLALLLTCFGILMVYEASAVVAFRDFRNKYHFLKLQSLWALIGFFFLVFFSFFDYHRLFSLSFPIFLFALLLSALVLIPHFSFKAYGARRWLNLGFITLQPSEFAKLALVLYLSALFSQKRDLKGFILPNSLLFLLTLLGKDLGTTLVLFAISLSLYFLAGAPLFHFLLLLPPSFLVFLYLVLKTPYRLKRLLAFLNPSFDPLGASYHIRQILIALGSGGWMGLGLGQSRQKYAYLPESFTDSIFAIIGEELGFIKCTFIILVYLFIFWRGFKIAQKAPDVFGQLLAGGITSWLGIQTFINLGAMVALIPLTGLPLPFLSYGGSNLVASLIGIGILVNISKNTTDK